MWPFRESPALKRRVTKLEEDLEALERQHRSLQVEWEDTIARIRRMYQRNAKLVDRIENDGGEEKEKSSTTGEMTDRQSELQQKILARRNRNGLLPG